MRCSLLGLSLLATTALAHGQSLFDVLNFRGSEKGGFGLYGVSVFSGTYVESSPYVLPSVGQAEQNITYGAAGSVGWQRHSEDINAGVLYSGSYGGVAQDSSLNSYSQSLGASVNFKLARKWTATISVAAQDTALDQSLFQPLGLSVISQVPATVSDFGAALGIGQFSSPQVASTLQQGAPLLQSPLTTALLGSKVLSYSGQISAYYAYSPRLSFYFGGFSGGGENRYGDQSNASVPNYVMPRTMGANAGVGFSYSLAQNTQMGVSFGEIFVRNNFEESYASSATISLGTKFGRRWFLGLSAGTSRANFIRETYVGAKPVPVVASASLGVKFRSQTLAASYSLAASDVFGFAVSNNSAVNGSWSWRRPGSIMGVFAGFGSEQIRNAGFISMSGWQGSAGTSITLSRQSALSLQYVYLDSASSFVTGGPTKIKMQSARASLSWSPTQVRR